MNNYFKAFVFQKLTHRLFICVNDLPWEQDIFEQPYVIHMYRLFNNTYFVIRTKGKLKHSVKYFWIKWLINEHDHGYPIILQQKTVIQVLLKSQDYIDLHVLSKLFGTCLTKSSFYPVISSMFVCFGGNHTKFFKCKLILHYKCLTLCNTLLHV